MYEVYEYTPKDTFDSVAKSYGISVSSLLELNGISFPCKYRNIKDYYDSKSAIGSYEQPYIFIPAVGSGGNPLLGSTYDSLVARTGTITWDAPEADYSPISAGCYIVVGGSGAVFPCFPEEVSESVSSSYNSEIPLGRQEPFYVYENSGPRTVNVSFRMHREMFPTITGLDSLINLIESGVYSSSNGVPAKRVFLKIGGQISISGIINGQVSVTWSETLNAIPSVFGGWSNAHYNIATVSFSVSEVTGGYPTKA